MSRSSFLNKAFATTFQEGKFLSNLEFRTGPIASSSGRATYRNVTCISDQVCAFFNSEDDLYRLSAERRNNFRQSLSLLRIRSRIIYRVVSCIRHDGIPENGHLMNYKACNQHILICFQLPVENDFYDLMNDSPIVTWRSLRRPSSCPPANAPHIWSVLAAEMRNCVNGWKRLLQAHDRVGDFLEQSPQKTPLDARSGASVGEKPGDRIGHYKLLQQIGEGGCGVVFMAEQEEPVRRRVALKIIKPGMDTKSVIARFEAERQALALMDHPNIAKVFDAGATESGRPYFVMELVRGVKITEYCDQHSLTTEERLKLFVQVCQAVQHAHQKGIIHRDIKPSNILVTTTPEGAALPVVIDFGIAKATTNQRLTDKTLFTAFEMLIGTPAYMSPEQAELTSVDVDTRTDIYSLGVLLYELLTGSTPFDTGELLKAGLDEIRRVIREQEPVRPSTRLSKMTEADLTTVAQHRKSEPPRLIRAVRGDLDWIAMKALEKDRTRRYETANGLALDVQRFLANEPISARPPSKLYKFQKTVLRNKLLFTGIGVIALLLVVSLIVVSASLAKERQARREAEAASVKSQQVTKFLEDMLNGVGPSVARGRDTTMLREILDQTAERVGKEMTNQPAVEAELRSLIGRLYQEIGNDERAEEMHRAALAIQRKLFGPESKEAAASLNDLGIGVLAEKNCPRRNSGSGSARHPGGGSSATRMRTRLLRSMIWPRCSGMKAGSQRRKPMAREALGIRRKLFGNENLASGGFAAQPQHYSGRRRQMGGSRSDGAGISGDAAQTAWPRIHAWRRRWTMLPGRWCHGQIGGGAKSGGGGLLDPEKISGRHTS